jgi:long-chain fatty acid transport protein
MFSGNYKSNPAPLAVALGLALVAAAPAWGAAFQLLEQNSSGGGHAYAGEAARANDASTIFFNPAGMARLSGSQGSAALHLILPSFDFSGGATFNKDHPAMQAAGLGGIAFDQGSGNASGDVAVVVPNLYYVHDAGPDWKFGIGINTPYGLETEYDSQWSGRYSAIQSKLLTININPSLSYQVSPELSLGAGFSLEYAEATLSNAVDYNLTYLLARQRVSALPALPLRPGQTSGDGVAEVTGDDWGYGFNLGLLWQPAQGTRVGLSYRSKVAIELDGDATFSDPSDATSQQALKLLRAGGALQNTGAHSAVDLPELVMLHFYHDLTPQLALLGGVNWTKWDRMEQLLVTFDNPAQPASVMELNYENAYFVSLGLIYRLNPQWTLHTGIGYDKSPISEAHHRTPRIPDNDRRWLSLGASYALSKQLSLDVGYSHLFVSDIPIDSSDAYSQNSPAGNSGFHRLTGSYEATVDIFNMQANWRF